MAQVTDAVKSRGGRATRVVRTAVFASWLAGALLFAALPAGSDGRYFAANGLYVGAAVFVLYALVRAVRGARERLLWGLLVAGVFANFVGDLGWSGLQGTALGAQGASLPHAAYLLSYLFFGGALLRLVGLATRRITLVTSLDAVFIMFSTGILTWYFFLGAVVSASGAAGWWEISSVLSWVLFDAALLFLCLVVLSAPGRPPFAGALAMGFLAFMVADGLYLVARAAGSYADAGWPDVVWSLGLASLGLAALDAQPVSAGGQQRIAPWRVFLFWFGPLSPAMHLAVVLLWAATHPPVPAYAAAGAAVLFLYLALRVALVSFTSRRLSDEGEAMARKLEGSRVLSEMHDTVKQGVHGVSLTLRDALDAARRGEHARSTQMVSNALRASRETEFQVSRPYEEIRTPIHGEGRMRPRNYLRHRLVRFEDYFGIKSHEDLQAPLEALSPMELAAVYRFAVEAFWNVAKHSGAENLRLESRRVGNLLLVRVRDDGRGFDPDDPPPGMGLAYLRERAREVGAEFDVISAPNRGTTVQLRFRLRKT